MDKKDASNLPISEKNSNFAFAKTKQGGLAQLARALAWHARGHRFDSDILHKEVTNVGYLFFYRINLAFRALNRNFARRYVQKH